MKSVKQSQDPTLAPPRWTLQRYCRFWAVYDQGTLVVVTVYKKGALAMIQRLAPPSTTTSEETRDGRSHP